MKIKKFEGKSEQALLEQIRDELGLTAIILNIKKKPRKGLFAFFRKQTVVITAAYEDKTEKDKQTEEKLAAQQRMQARSAEKQPSEPKVQEIQLADQQQKIDALEHKLTSTEALLAKVLEQLNIAEQMARRTDDRKYDNIMVQMFYDSLTEQGVTQEIAEKLLEEVDAIDEQDKVEISLIVKVVYNTIMGIFGEPRIIDTESADKQTVVFMGPTGVGKTTTIAKLSSMLTLDKGLKVGLITADTYRIAAVEQLRVYADILGMDIRVVYNEEDLDNHIGTMQAMHDVLLIDTAGRSHRNTKTLSELNDMLYRMPDCKKFLVLSVTTKYEDLISIVNTYAALTDFDLVFTKLDETGHLGAVLNICYLTGKKVSYITFGQNVPDDIEVAQPDKIAKALLGLGW